MVDSLLVLARSDAATDASTVVDLQAIAVERAASWQPVARERGTEVTVEDPGPTLVRAQLGALEQILDNLLANALDMAPPGTAVAVHIVEATPWIELHVTDQGPGMSPEVRDHAFERFWRAPGATGKGFGLGLAIVEQLARSCGGDARLDTGPDGHGLDAVVRLRVATELRNGTGAQRAGKPNPALTSG